MLCKESFTYFNDSLQFLDKPIALETFHRLIETREGFCKYNMEIIEDKAIQNICGRGKIFIKYEKDDDSENYLTILRLIQLLHFL